MESGIFESHKMHKYILDATVCKFRCTGCSKRTWLILFVSIIFAYQWAYSHVRQIKYSIVHSHTTHTTLKNSMDVGWTFSKSYSVLSSYTHTMDNPVWISDVLCVEIICSRIFTQINWIRLTNSDWGKNYSQYVAFSSSSAWVGYV